VWFDTLVLLKDAPNRAQGLAFIDYLLRPEVIAPVSDHLSYPNGNRAATPLVAAATRAVCFAPSQRASFGVEVRPWTASV